MLIHEELAQDILGAAIEVHRELGPGLLESAYEECLCHKLNLRNRSFRRQASLPVHYNGIRLHCGYEADVIVEDKVLIELKSVQEVHPIHEAQLITYLKLSQVAVGFLLNFNVAKLMDGVTRRVV